MADLAFDTGHTKPLATLVAEAYLALLEPLVYDDGDAENDRGPYLKHLGRSPAGVDALLDGGEDAPPLQEIVAPLPACMVFVAGAKVDEELGGGDQLRWTFEVIIDVVTGYPGQWILGRLDPDQDGDARRDPGCWAIAQHAIEYIANRTLPGLEAISDKPIKIVEQRGVASTPDWTAWRVVTTVNVIHDIKEPDERGAAEVAAVEVAHNVADRGVITRQRRTF